MPSAGSTVKPTAFPSNPGTSKNPSLDPTNVPTNDPSLDPTNNPTLNRNREIETKYPSPNPTNAASNNPSTSPSKGPITSNIVRIESAVSSATDAEDQESPLAVTTISIYFLLSLISCSVLIVIIRQTRKCIMKQRVIKTQSHSLAGSHSLAKQSLSAVNTAWTENELTPTPPPTPPLIISKANDDQHRKRSRSPCTLR
eukprot:TRINITY_DN13318_c0_g1_i1.p1 TRINITY_DN13318_c0_g1~~TRINITY_DN13318_c0_g1_i1.p1  ORF type:complete len:199 (+),score=23.88 TRINITY_DN13318_c0_g1_i1:182-778(+)